MEYAIDRLCKLSGVTSRALRHYHRIGLLVPLRTNSAGYRIYGPREVDRLQQILFFRELGVGLAEIGRILDAPGFDPDAALRGHLAALLARRDELDGLIATVTKTIEHREENLMMQDSDKFAGFKKDLIRENEEKYGAEIREKYGEEAVAASNARMMNMSEHDYSEMQAVAAQVQARLEAAVEAGLDPASSAGQEIALLHRRWLGFTWGSYSLEAHRGLGQMYVDDPRFTAYYDSAVPGCAAFLRDAIHALEG